MSSPLDKDDTVNGNSMRFLAETDGEIADYFIVLHGMLKPDKVRCSQYGLQFDESAVCTLAPSVADMWQNAGLGSAMMRALIPLLGQIGYSQLVLWCGTQAGNKRAIHFYEKCGFRRLGVFPATVNGAVIDNYDMVLDLAGKVCGVTDKEQGT